jgi:hypothetical protein
MYIEGVTVISFSRKRMIVHSANGVKTAVPLSALETA